MKNVPSAELWAAAARISPMIEIRENPCKSVAKVLA
jgi:hypothetical protein